MNDFERRIAALSPEQREALMRKMRERGGAAVESPPAPERPHLRVGPVDRFAPVPPTDFQEVLWLGRSGLFDAGGCGSNVYIEHELQGSVWPFADSLTTALRTVIARHELLRTIVLPDGRLQLLAEVPPFEIEVDDLSGHSDAWIEERLSHVRDEMRYAKRPVDRWPLFDVVLHQINGGRIRLHARFEAILIDGAARSVLVHELTQLLGAPDRELPPLEVSFLDYARALADFRSTATYARSRAYWMARLPSLPPPPILPLARPLTPGTVPRIVKRQPEVLDPQSWQDLSRRARQAGLSPTSALTAAFAEVLRLWSAQPGFTVGCGGSYRPDIHPQMERAVGSFTIIHLLAVQDGPGTFLERARRLQARITADLDHQEFSGHQVLREYNRLHRMGARALLPIHFNSVIEYGHETAPAPDAAASQATPVLEGTALQADFQEIELMISLPQALILWVATENGRGGLELVSQAVEEVFPDGFIPDLIGAYRDLLTRLAASDSAWNEERPAQRVGTWSAPEAWLAGLAGALGYGAHPRFVESALERHPAVRQAAVAWHTEEGGHGRLVAWILPRDGHPPEDEELRRHLRATLPEPLVPAAFVRLEQLPRTADGTVDRGALPAPPEPAVGEWGELEMELAALWEKVLGRRPAALTDDFFTLGGDSVSAVRLLTRVTARWGRSVDAGELFARPTLAGVADAVRRCELAGARALRKEEALPDREPAARAPRFIRETARSAPPLARNMRTFLLLWLSQFVSGVGTGLGSFALGVWVYRQNASATQYSMVAFVATCTALLASPLAGVLADRWDRRRLILLGDLGAAVMTGLIALALYTGQMQLSYVYVIIFFMVSFSSLQGPALIASTSMLVPREQLARASGMTQAAGIATGLICPPLAGALIPVLDYHGIIAIDLTTFLFAFLVLLFMRLPQPPQATAHRERRSMLGDLLLGWSYLRERPGLLYLLGLFAVTNFCLAIVQVLLTPLILSFGSATELGTVQAAAAAGGLIGSLALTFWGGPRYRVRGILLFILLQAPILLLGGLQPSIGLITLAIFVFMGLSPFVGGLSQAIWQSKVAHAIQGRVFAIRGVIASSAMPLAFLLAGPLADRVFEPLMAPGGALAGTIGQIIGAGQGRGVGLLFITLGLFIIFAVLLFSLNPRLRNIESELPDASADSEAPSEGPQTETRLHSA